MGVRTQYPNRTAEQAQREIRRCGGLRPDPEFLAGQRALQAASTIKESLTVQTKGEKILEPEKACCQRAGLLTTPNLGQIRTKLV